MSTIVLVLIIAITVEALIALGVTFAAPWIGILLTGIFASRGANFVSDLFKKLQSLSTGT